MCLPEEQVWNGACNECGPHPGQPCTDGYGECGILPWLFHGKSCGKGCGEVYWGEWISDPPDCCDPCDQCTGDWTGPHGFCNLGPCQRLLAALHGYRYCPAPDCGPVCGGLCHKPACGPACGSCSTCGGSGCATCGVAGGDVLIEADSAWVLPESVPTHSSGVPAMVPGTHSILDENWDLPKSKPVPGKPIHKAQQPPRGQMGRQSVPAAPRTAAPRTVAARPATSPRNRPVGNGVRPANYESR